MTNTHTNGKDKRRWSRPQLERDQPLRSVGGVYRTAEGDETGIAGMPLASAEDAVVAAVRMAYKVAQAQVDRSTRLARSLRSAGDRAAGPGSDRKAVDATEALISRAMLSALAWLEGLSAEDENPLKRMVLAQYRLLGTALGLMPQGGSDRRPSASQQPASGDTQAADSDDSVPLRSYRPSSRVRVILKAKGRPVCVRHLDVAGRPPFSATPIYFYSVEQVDSDPLEVQFAMDAGGGATLTFATERRAPPGRWRAAICDPATDEQIGIVEIEI